MEEEKKVEKESVSRQEQQKHTLEFLWIDEG